MNSIATKVLEIFIFLLALILTVSMFLSALALTGLYQPWASSSLGKIKGIF